MLSHSELLIASCPATEKGLTLFCVNISQHVSVHCWHLMCPSITHSHAFHPCSAVPGKEPVMMPWQLSQQYCMCHSHINPRRNNSNFFFSCLPHKDENVSHVRQVGDPLCLLGLWSWGCYCPGTAYSWPQ